MCTDGDDHNSALHHVYFLSEPATITEWDLETETAKVIASSDAIPKAKKIYWYKGEFFLLSEGEKVFRFQLLGGWKKMLDDILDISFSRDTLWAIHSKDKRVYCCRYFSDMEYIALEKYPPTRSIQLCMLSSSLDNHLCLFGVTQGPLHSRCQGQLFYVDTNIPEPQIFSLIKLAQLNRSSDDSFSLEDSPKKMLFFRTNQSSNHILLQMCSKKIYLLSRQYDLGLGHPTSDYSLVTKWHTSAELISLLRLSSPIISAEEVPSSLSCSSSPTCNQTADKQCHPPLLLSTSHLTLRAFNLTTISLQSYGGLYSRIWRNTTKKKIQHVSIWRPDQASLLQHNMIFFGDVIERTKVYVPKASCMVVQLPVVCDDSSTEDRLFCLPTSFDCICSHQIKNSADTVYFWRAVAPEGFHSMGMLATTSAKEPVVPQFRCIHRELLDEGEFSRHSIWKFGKMKKTFHAVGVHPTTAPLSSSQSRSVGLGCFQVVEGPTVVGSSSLSLSVPSIPKWVLRHSCHDLPTK